MKNKLLITFILYFMSMAIYSASKPPICPYRYDLPNPVSENYHFNCSYEGASKYMPIVMANHAVLIKGFTYGSHGGGFVTTSEKLNKRYFTAKADPYHQPSEQAYICSLVKIHCEPGPGINRSEQGGDFGLVM